MYVTSDYKRVDTPDVRIRSFSKKKCSNLKKKNKKNKSRTITLTA